MSTGVATWPKPPARLPNLGLFLRCCRRLPRILCPGGRKWKSQLFPNCSVAPEDEIDRLVHVTVRHLQGLDVGGPVREAHIVKLLKLGGEPFLGGPVVRRGPRHGPRHASGA